MILSLPRGMCDTGHLQLYKIRNASTMGGIIDENV